jgi:nitroreductase
MDLSEAVNNRRTIRKFLPEPISADLVKKLINNARWAPSWGNTQPCEFVVATGTAVKTLREENRKALMAGIQSTPDFKMPETWPPHLKLRYIDVGKSVLTSLEIAREDQQGRLDYYGDMFSLFEAPALLVVLIDKNLDPQYALLDVGLFLQTFMLLAHAEGLGTATLAASVHYPDIVRRLLPVPPDKKLVIGVAIGRPDLKAPVNSFKRNRASIEDLIHS